MKTLTLAVLGVLAVSGTGAQESRLRAPEFKVDPAWPVVPNGWVLGEVTSVSVDSRDNV